MVKMMATDISVQGAALVTAGPEHARPKLKTSEERQKFDAGVAKLRLTGLTFSEIASHYRCSKATVHAAYRRFMVNFRTQHMDDQSVLLAEYHSRVECIWRDHLRAYEESKEPGQETGDLRILEAAAGILNSAFDRMMASGIIPRAKDRLEVEAKVACISGQFTLTPELAEKIANSYQQKEEKHESP